MSPFDFTFTDERGREDRMIAQLNVARAVADLDAPEMADFMMSLDRINTLAEHHDGFVWRLKDEGGNATDIKVTDDPRFIMNLSVWRSVPDLHHFVFTTDHREFVQRGREFFEAPQDKAFVLWRLEGAEMPTIDEAFARLQHLRNHGPHDYAFDWQSWKKYAL